MATTNFSGPITAGNIRNTTGTTVGTNVKNTGQVLMSQSFSFTFATEGTATDTNVVIPANSQIVRIDVNVETAFNDSGADLLELVQRCCGGTGCKLVATMQTGVYLRKWTLAE